MTKENCSNCGKFCKENSEKLIIYNNGDRDYLHNVCFDCFDKLILDPTEESDCVVCGSAHPKDVVSIETPTTDEVQLRQRFCASCVPSVLSL